MLPLSANLGFLWNDRPLPDAIRAAKAFGFAAVECHWPYAEKPAAVRAALAETGLPMLGLNTNRGNPGEFGLSALPGREAEARAAIDEAFDFAEAIGARAVHVMAGVTEPDVQSFATFEANLHHACDRASQSGTTVLIEPLNSRDVPGYVLTSAEKAADLIRVVDRQELKIMFDCYHQQIMGGDLLRRIEALLPMIGHLQIAAVPSRAEPDEGEVAYDRLLAAVESAGYKGFVGAEYKPRGNVEAGLVWRDAGIGTVGKSSRSIPPEG